MKLEVIISGFGGQGILFMGNLLANMALAEGYFATYLPVYGPEMRGGTCNCTVIISDKEIASPVTRSPSYLIIMNLPSFEKFMPFLSKKGKALVNLDLVPEEKIKAWKSKRKIYELPFTTISEKEGMPGLANICALGAFFALTGVFRKQTFKSTLKKVLGEKKARFFEPNLKIFEKGVEIFESRYPKG